MLSAPRAMLQKMIIDVHIQRKAEAWQKAIIQIQKPLFTALGHNLFTIIFFVITELPLFMTGPLVCFSVVEKVQ